MLEDLRRIPGVETDFWGKYSPIVSDTSRDSRLLLVFRRGKYFQRQKSFIFLRVLLVVLGDVVCLWCLAEPSIFAFLECRKYACGFHTNSTFLWNNFFFSSKLRDCGCNFYIWRTSKAIVCTHPMTHPSLHSANIPVTFPPNLHLTLFSLIPKQTSRPSPRLPFAFQMQN